MPDLKSIGEHWLDDKGVTHADEIAATRRVPLVACRGSQLTPTLPLGTAPREVLSEVVPARP